MGVSRIKGFADLFPPESTAYVRMESLARELFARYGFVELRTPLMEFTELFQRGIGEETDVVQKEMYTFADSKGRNMSLRPEATAGVMRAFIDSGLAGQQGGVHRLFTTGPMFRHERPQKGRMRQFHQINCECLGSASPLADAELIAMLMRYLHGLGIGGISLQINSLGCATCRPHFKEALVAYLRGQDQGQYCEDCQRRIDTNPLRVLDCKKEACSAIANGAPHLLDCLCDDCRSHFSQVLALLESQGIAYNLNHRLVRGLDYYCRTTFEVVSNNIGAQTAIAGGGRYDGLVQQLGGPAIPGVGFACGMERLALLLPEVQEQRPDFFILAMEESCFPQAFSLAEALRSQGLRGSSNQTVAGFKSLMRQAGKSGARYCCILGPDEVAANEVTLKNLDNSDQQRVSFDAVANHITTGTDHE